MGCVSGRMSKEDYVNFGGLTEKKRYDKQLEAVVSM